VQGSRLKAITIRIDNEAHELIRTEADLAGTSLSAFIRESAILFACVHALQRTEGRPAGYDDFFYTISETVRRLRRVTPEQEPPGPDRTPL
jgi:hypothetical protein